MQAAKEASTTRGTWHKPELDEELVLVLDPVEELELEPVLVLVDVALEVAVAVAARKEHTHTHSVTQFVPHSTTLGHGAQARVCEAKDPAAHSYTVRTSCTGSASGRARAGRAAGGGG